MQRESFAAAFIFSVVLTGATPCSAQLDVKLKATVAASPPVELQDAWECRSALSPNGLFFLQFNREEEIVLWDTQSGKSLATIQTAFAAIEEINCKRFKWSRTSRYFAVVGCIEREEKKQPGWAVTIWDAKSRKQVAVLRHLSRPVALDFSPNDSTVAVVAEQGQWEKGRITLWELTTGKERANLVIPNRFDRITQDPRNGGPSVEYSTDGKILVLHWRANPNLVVNREGQSLHFWDTVTEEGRSTLIKNAPKASGFHNVSWYNFVPKSDILLVQSGRIQAYEISTGKELTTELVTEFGGIIYFVDRTCVLKPEGEWGLDVFDCGGSKVIKSKQIRGIANSVVGFTDDGKQVTVITREGKFQTWELSRLSPKDK